MYITWVPFMNWLIEHGIRIVVILVLAFIAWFILNKTLPPVLRRGVIHYSKGDSKRGLENRTNTLSRVFVGSGKVLIFLIALFMVLSELDVPVGPILAGFGVAGIAVGFGAQYLIRDLIAGTFIIMENQYRVGDRIKIGEVFGLVEEVNLRKTVVRDWDGMLHHIPNGAIEIVTNATRRYSMVNLDVPVAYGTDLDHAIEVINRVGIELAEDENWKERLTEAPQVLRVNNFGDSGIDIRIVGRVQPHEKWAVTGELRLRLKKAFDKEDIEIPWPHTKVYFGNMPDSLKKR
ncbi:MAG: mechanosensitive ion channel family protein [Chloroflexota bacterium]